MTSNNPVSEASKAHKSNLQLQAEQHPLVDDQSFSSMEAYVLHLMHIKAYEKAAQLASNKSVLDLGCNVGYGLQILASTAISVAGIDVSPQAVEAARRRLGGTADIRIYNGRLCSFASHAFDVVASFQVIEHVSDYDAYFSEIIRLTRPDGMVLFTTPNARLRLDPGMKPWNAFHVREFAPAELGALLSQWFDGVEILGLFGTDELQKIESRRCESARALARAQPVGPGKGLRGAVKHMFPWLVPVHGAFRAWTKRDQDPVRLARSEMARFSTKDLCYKTNPVDDALDLMAVCHGPRGR